MVQTPLKIKWDVKEFGKTYKFVLKRRSSPDTETPSGWLGVKLLYLGMPLSGLSVQFYRLTGDKQKGALLGQPLTTDEAGMARFPQSVEIANYGCEIPNQPLAIISPVEEQTEFVTLALPLSEPQAELYDSFVEELETLDEDEDEDEEEEAGQEDQGWLGVKLVYLGMPLSGLSVQFYRLTEDGQKGAPLGQSLTTDQEGLARFPQSVEIAKYGCEIPNQPLAIINPVEEQTEFVTLALPLSEPQAELYDSFVEELETLDEDEDQEGDTGQEDQGWLGVKLVYLGMPLSGLSVQFYRLTETKEKGAQLGQALTTDEAGLARLPQSVEIANYGCEIPNQPLAIISPVEEQTDFVTLALPLSEPQAELYDPFVEELETLDEDEDEEEEIIGN